MNPSHLTHRVVPLLLGVAFAVTLTLQPFDAEAAQRKARKATTKESYAGSAETTKERERRLARECRGRPNAGACLGFGQ